MGKSLSEKVLIKSKHSKFRLYMQLDYLSVSLSMRNNFQFNSLTTTQPCTLINELLKQNIGYHCKEHLYGNWNIYHYEHKAHMVYEMESNDWCISHGGSDSILISHLVSTYVGGSSHSKNKIAAWPTLKELQKRDSKSGEKTQWQQNMHGKRYSKNAKQFSKVFDKLFFFLKFKTERKKQNKSWSGKDYLYHKCYNISDNRKELASQT